MKLDITVPHNLGQVRALERLEELMKELRKEPPSPYVKLVGDVIISIEGSSVSFEIEITQGKKVNRRKGSATVAPNYVKLTTEDIPAFYPIVWWISRTIQSKLAAALA